MKITKALAGVVLGIGLVSGAPLVASAHGPGQGMQMGPGMMQGGGMGPGMMGGGMMMPMMMQRMMMMRMMMGGMTGGALGPGMIYGMGPDAGKDLSVDDVKGSLERVLAIHGNKRLKLGKVTEADKDSILAEIVTVDGSLVQKLSIDRHNRIVRQVD